MPPQTIVEPPLLVSITDWALQALFAFFIFVHPWFLGPGKGGRAFGRPFLSGFIWGIWRLLYFDGITKNDVPGMGYLVTPLFGGIVAAFFYSVRSAILDWRANRRRLKSPNQASPVNGALEESRETNDARAK